MAERENTSANLLPEIAKGKASSSQSASQFLEDSGLELRGGASSLLSRPSTAGSSARGGGWGAKSPPPGSGRFTPSPPPGAKGPARSRPLLNTTGSRKCLDYVWASKGELERTEEALTTLRSEAVEMQAKIRALQHCEQDLASLERGCSRIAEVLGCSVGGVAASAMPEILLTRTNDLAQKQEQAIRQHETCSSELEQCRGELAAISTRLSGTEMRLKQATEERGRLEADLKQVRAEAEGLRQTCARTSATVELLRRQLSEAEQKVGRSQNVAVRELTQLQTEVGQLKKELTEKEDSLAGWKQHFDAVEKERAGLADRLVDSEALHTELCTQLSAILQLDSTQSFNLDHLLSQASGVVEECEELRLHCDTLGNTVHTAELETKASRETILRLVSEAKSRESLNEGLREKLARLESEVEEKKASVLTSDHERAALVEQLKAGKETIAVLHHELQDREERLMETQRSLTDSRLASDSNKSLANSVQSDHESLVSTLANALGMESSSDAEAILQAVRDLAQRCSQQSSQLLAQSSLLGKREASIKSLQASSTSAERDLARERAKVVRAETELSSLQAMKEGLAEDLEKSHTFSRKMARAVALESSTAEILATGDFAHDAIIMKAEQLVKMENDALLRKQTAVYSLQRKLKACQQDLRSKELHMSLLQKKMENLEQSLKSTGHQKKELESATSNAKKLEKRLEKLQSKVEEQRSTISQLESDTAHLHQLKESCRQLEADFVRLKRDKQALEHSSDKQSQQLVTLKQKAKERLDKDGKKMEGLRAELEASCAQVEKLREMEEKLCVFKTAVQRLLRAQEEFAGAEDMPSDYDLITSLEKLLGSQKKQKDNVKCLEASLRQLEQGFKTSYNDALTLLHC